MYENARPDESLKFPKGRLDSLTSHLLRRCRNVTQQDREWVFQQIQQNPARASSAVNQTSSDTLSNTRQEMFGTQTLMPALQQQSALDTLAEVSSDMIAEQVLLTELRGHTGLRSPRYPLATTIPRNSRAKTSPPLVSRPSEQIGPSTAASPLVQTASAANQQLELTQSQNSARSDGKSFVDPQLYDVPRSTQVHANNNPDSDTYVPSWRPAVSTIAPRPTGQSMKSSEESNAAFETLHRPTQVKKRGRFDDDRRKQVSDLRKRGACIRCRMLKKPCSGDTPCITCRTVESARLWKGTCVRTRLADEFTLYSTNLFHAKAKIEVSAAVQGLSQECLPGIVDARFHPGSKSCMDFTTRAYGKTASKSDIDLSQSFAQNRIESSSTWILDENEINAEKLETYFDQNIDVFVKNEPSTFMQATLKQAQELIRAEETIKMTKPSGDQEKRSSYNLQHQLLRTLVELWILTGLLTSSDDVSLQLRYNVQLPRGESECVERAIQQISWSITSTSQSYNLIQTQLLAAVEARASKLSKAAINELERRLLQRQQVSRFGTFLAAVLLLSCAERMCAFYHRLDVGEEHFNGQPGQQELSGSGDGDSAHNKDSASSWPLDSSPLHLWSQGQSFSDLISMLLRMRALPSLTAKKTNDSLIADKNSNGSFMDQSSANEQLDEHTMETTWLESLRSRANEVASTTDGVLPVKAGTEAWDMRLVSRLLWPGTD